MLPDFRSRGHDHIRTKSNHNLEAKNVSFSSLHILTCSALDFSSNFRTWSWFKFQKYWDLYLGYNYDNDICGLWGLRPQVWQWPHNRNNHSFLGYPFIITVSSRTNEYSQVRRLWTVGFRPTWKVSCKKAFERECRSNDTVLICYTKKASKVRG